MSAARRRAPRAVVVGVLLSLAACDEAKSSLGVLRGRDAALDAYDVGVEGVSPLRCSVRFTGSPVDRVAVIPSGAAVSVEDDRLAVVGGPWSPRAGSALVDRPTATLLLPDATCPGGGMRRVTRTLQSDGSVAVEPRCIPGVEGLRRVESSFNGTTSGACLDLTDASGDGVAGVNAPGTAARIAFASRRPWRESRCWFSATQRTALIAVDGSGARWFQFLSGMFEVEGEAQPLESVGRDLRPRGLVEGDAFWLSFWESADASRAFVERHAADGRSMTREEAVGWFPGATSLRVFGVDAVGFTGRALVNVDGVDGPALYAALVCPDGRHRVRRLYEGAVRWASLIEVGAGLALFIERDDGAARALDVAVFDGGLSWRRDFHTLLRGPSLLFHAAIGDDAPAHLVVWYSLALDAGAEALRVALVDFSEGL